MCRNFPEQSSRQNTSAKLKRHKSCCGRSSGSKVIRICPPPRRADGRPMNSQLQTRRTRAGTQGLPSSLTPSFAPWLAQHLLLRNMAYASQEFRRYNRCSLKQTLATWRPRGVRMEKDRLPRQRWVCRHLSHVHTTRARRQLFEGESVVDVASGW